MVETLTVETSIIDVCCYYVQIWNQRNIFNLIQICKKAYEHSKLSHETETFKNFESKCFKTLFILISIGVFWNVLIYITMMRFRWQSTYFGLHSVYLDQQHRYVHIAYFCIFLIFIYQLFHFSTKTLKFKIWQLQQKNF